VPREVLVSARAPAFQVIPSTTAATATTRIENAAVNAVTAEENHRIRGSASRWMPARGNAGGIAGRESIDIGQTFPAGTQASAAMPNNVSWNKEML
jgi:hypothetical protein